MSGGRGDGYRTEHWRRRIEDYAEDYGGTSDLNEVLAIRRQRMQRICETSSPSQGIWTCMIIALCGMQDPEVHGENGENGTARIGLGRVDGLRGVWRDSEGFGCPYVSRSFGRRLEVDLLAELGVPAGVSGGGRGARRPEVRVDRG